MIVYAVILGNSVPVVVYGAVAVDIDTPFIYLTVAVDVDAVYAYAVQSGRRCKRRLRSKRENAVFIIRQFVSCIRAVDGISFVAAVAIVELAVSLAVRYVAYAVVHKVAAVYI